MSRVLVTGGSGFIGRHVVACLSLRGHEVHATSRMQAKADDAVWHKLDLMDGSATQAVLAEVRPEILIHLAWYTNPNDYRTSPANLEWTEASVRLVRLFAESGGRRFVGAGSCAEYDDRFGYCSEAATPSHPSSLYGICKNAVNDVVASASEELGIEAAWARIFFTYGPGEPRDKLVSYIVSRLLEGRVAECTAGDQFRDYIYVEDVAQFLVDISDSSAVGVFNVGSGVPVTVADLAMMVGRIVGAPELIQLGVRDTPQDDPRMLVADTRRARSVLAWKPLVGLESGLERTVLSLRGGSAP